MVAATHDRGFILGSNDHTPTMGRGYQNDWVVVEPLLDLHFLAVCKALPYGDAMISGMLIDYKQGCYS